MKTSLLLAAFYLAAVAAGQAATPNWKIQEIYSSHTGDVEFIKLVAASDGQNAIQGLTLNFVVGSKVTNSLTFDKNVGSGTGNHTILVGTANLCTLYGVRPDFVIPAAFFSAGANHTIDYAKGADRVSLAALPKDGIQSLDGVTTNVDPTATAILAQAAPQNFAGQSAVITGSPSLPNPIMFVTQFPVPADFTTVASVFGNHDGALDSAGRGGDLYIRYPNGALKNLTAAAGFGNTGRQGAQAIAVREPCVSWDGTKAVFAMVIGAPTARYQVAEYYWQLYEVTGLKASQTPVITKVANQPANFNNVSPIYGTDDRIIFATDMPRNGQRYLYPQLDEYEEAPSTSGLWSLDPTTGDLFQLDHSPSGSFTPILDSFGRVIFTRWDHLQRDQQADTDALDHANNYGTFDYADESATAARLTDNEVFPEPRSARTDLLKGTNLEGHSFNQFFPWMMNEDGMALETLNHIGRHELASYFDRSLNDDANLVEFIDATSGRVNRHSLANLLQLKEDPAAPGTYYGVDAPEFQTHASGQIFSLSAAPTTNADRIKVAYVTDRLTESVTNEGATPSPNHSGHYRSPLPLSDGTLVAVHTGETRADTNSGTTAQPQSRYDFRLVTLRTVNGVAIPNQPLTAGIVQSVSYYDPDTLVSYSGEMWELDPVEVRARPRPTRRVETLEAPEHAVLVEEGVDETALRNYLRDNGLALIVSRNVTTRDDADRQQPFNLRIAGTATQTIANSGKLYDVANMQIFQADLLRGVGLTPGQTTPRAGRRVLARPLHDATNPSNPTGPVGSVKLGTDGSMAAFVPARRALSWQLTDPTATPVVRERYWLTFQSGEIRTCTSCHGVNIFDQAHERAPTNKPEALRSLLQYWKTIAP